MMDWTIFILLVVLQTVCSKRVQREGLQVCWNQDVENFIIVTIKLKKGIERRAASEIFLCCPSNLKGR
jgi:hypothetical protein